MLTLVRPPLRELEKILGPVCGRWFDALWRKLGQEGPLGVGEGGTGATTVPAARANLGAAASGVNSDITELTLGAGIRILAGAGNPEALVTANPGSIYLRTDIGAPDVLYLKETGSEAVGWIAK